MVARIGHNRAVPVEALFETLAEGDAVTTLSLPFASSHLHVLLARKIPTGQPSS